MSRWMPILVLAPLCAALWWSQGVAANYGMFGGRLAFSLDLAASLVTSVIGVVIVAEAMVAIGVSALTSAEATGFERAAAYSIASAVAFLLVLSHFGVNITTVLATSAVLTVIVGLALQPTLGALIAGFTLNADRVLKIGDGILVNNETVTVTSVGWRSVVGTRGDGTRTILSNSRVLDGTVDILPAGVPVRAEVFLVAPLAADPQRVGTLIEDTVSEMPLVDEAQPIVATPISFDPEKAQARYRIRYWTRSYLDRQTVEEQIFGRLWYAFQRERLAWPVSLNFAVDFKADRPTLGSSDWTARLATGLDALKRRGGMVAPDLRLETVADVGTLLLYDTGERIVMPDRVEGCRCLLIQGRLSEVAFDLSSMVRPPAERSRASRRAELKTLSTRLARKIGPFAEFAVQHAALGETELPAIRETVAMEIDDANERRAFAGPAVSEIAEGYGPGFLCDLRRGATGALQPDPLLRAETPVAIVAIPAELFEAVGTRQQSRSRGDRTDAIAPPSA